MSSDKVGQFFRVNLGTQTVSRENIDSILVLAEKGIRELFRVQQDVIARAHVR